MVNVDFCVREAELGLCDNYNLHSLKIANINDSERVKIFRNKNNKDIEYILYNCSNTIKAYIIDKFYNNKHTSLNDIKLIHGSNNNKIGADLIHKLPNNQYIDIEVKFGQETNKNIGMAVFNKIFGCNIFSTILSIKQRNVWKELYYKEQDKEKQLERLHNTLNNGIKIFNSTQKSKNYILTKEEQNFMEAEILNISGNTQTQKHFYIKFILDGCNFSSFSCLNVGIGSWIVEPVKYLSNKIKRVNVYVKNYDTNIQIKYTLNWKNNYKYTDGIIADAKLGLKTPNWNVWVTAEVKKIS